MRNIQVIDGAENTGYWVYAVSDKAFSEIFPATGQDIEFISDFVDRVGEARAKQLLDAIWSRRVRKATAKGVHGTLFFELDFKKRYYPNKRETDLEDNSIQGTRRQARR